MVLKSCLNTRLKTPIFIRTMVLSEKIQIFPKKNNTLGVTRTLSVQKSIWATIFLNRKWEYFLCLSLYTLCWNLNKVGFEIPPHVLTEIICPTIEVSNSVLKEIPSLTSFRDIHWYTDQKGSSYVKWKSQNARNIVDLPLKMTVSMRNEKLD